MSLIAGVTGKPEVCGAANPAALGGGDRGFRGLEIRALLDLDKGQAPSTDGNEVYFAGWRLLPDGQDAVTAENENQSGKAFGPPGTAVTPSPFIPPSLLGRCRSEGHLAYLLRFMASATS